MSGARPRRTVLPKMYAAAKKILESPGWRSPLLTVPASDDEDVGNKFKSFLASLQIASSFLADSTKKVSLNQINLVAYLILEAASQDTQLSTHKQITSEDLAAIKKTIVDFDQEASILYRQYPATVEFDAKDAACAGLKTIMTDHYLEGELRLADQLLKNPIYKRDDSFDSFMASKNIISKAIREANADTYLYDQLHTTSLGIKLVSFYANSLPKEKIKSQLIKDGFSESSATDLSEIIDRNIQRASTIKLTEEEKQKAASSEPLEIEIKIEPRSEQFEAKLYVQDEFKSADSLLKTNKSEWSTIPSPTPEFFTNLIELVQQADAPLQTLQSGILQGVLTACSNTNKNFSQASLKEEFTKVGAKEGDALTLVIRDIEQRNEHIKMRNYVSAEVQLAIEKIKVGKHFPGLTNFDASFIDQLTNVIKRSDTLSFINRENEVLTQILLQVHNPAMNQDAIRDIFTTSGLKTDEDLEAVVDTIHRRKQAAGPVVPTPPLANPRERLTASTHKQSLILSPTPTGFERKCEIYCATVNKEDYLALRNTLGDEIAEVKSVTNKDITFLAMITSPPGRQPYLAFDRQMLGLAAYFHYTQEKAAKASPPSPLCLSGSWDLHSLLMICNCCLAQKNRFEFGDASADLNISLVNSSGKTSHFSIPKGKSPEEIQKFIATEIDTLGRDTTGVNNELITSLRVLQNQLRDDSQLSSTPQEEYVKSVKMSIDAISSSAFKKDLDKLPSTFKDFNRSVPRIFRNPSKDQEHVREQPQRQLTEPPLEDSSPGQGTPPKRTLRRSSSGPLS